MKLFLVILSLCVLSVAYAEIVPHGKYCGGVSGLVEMNVTVDQAKSAFNVSGNVFGANHQCLLEGYEYNPQSHTITIDKLSDPSDCLHKLLSQFGLSPTNVEIVFDPQSDQVSLQAGAGSLNLKQCGSKAKQPVLNFPDPMESVPHGKYCGGIQGLVEMNVTVDETKGVLNITGNVFGAMHICPNEPYTYLSSSHVIQLANLGKQSDCLHKLLSQFGLDPSTVEVVYGPSVDQVLVQADAGTLTLKQCSTAKYIPRVPFPRPMQTAPHGKYCGGIQGLVTLNVSVDETKGTMNVSGSVFGGMHDCPLEPYTYSSSNHVITLTNLGSSSDCLHKLLSSFGLDPSSVQIVYSPSANQVLLQASAGTLTLNQCGKTSVKQEPIFRIPIAPLETTPHGKYCGGIQGLVAMNVTVEEGKGTLNISGEVFGSKHMCPSEPYTYDATNHVITLVNLGKSSDCLSKLLSEFGLDPASVQIVYSPSADQVLIQASAGTITLHQCAKAKPSPMATIPHGKYCGGVSGIAELNVTVVSETKVNISGDIFGSASQCDLEPVTYDATTHVVTLTNLQSPSDCVHKLLQSVSIDPSSVQITYIPASDQLNLQASLGSIALKQCGSSRTML